jgi:hypothetical protein
MLHQPQLWHTQPAIPAKQERWQIDRSQHQADGKQQPLDQLTDSPSDPIETANLLHRPPGGDRLSSGDPSESTSTAELPNYEHRPTHYEIGSTPQEHQTDASEAKHSAP